MAINYEDLAKFKKSSGAKGKKTYISFDAKTEPEVVAKINDIKARGYDLKAIVAATVDQVHSSVMKQ